MGRTGWIVAAAALVAGLGLGWLAGSTTGGAGSDADRACAAAEELPRDLYRDDASGRERLVAVDRVVGVGSLAAAAGRTGDDYDDLDDLGRAGQRLAGVVRELRSEEYGEHRRALLDACAAR